MYNELKWRARIFYAISGKLMTTIRSDSIECVDFSAVFASMPAKRRRYFLIINFIQCKYPHQMVISYIILAMQTVVGRKSICESIQAMDAKNKKVFAVRWRRVRERVSKRGKA